MLIVYGDYCIDNMIFVVVEFKVVVVFDWELLMLGDLFVDFLYLLMSWVIEFEG